MIKRLAAFAFGLTYALSAAAAGGATLTDVKGPVLVNQGDEFVPAKPGMHLNPGDRLMVQGGGEANVKFDDECSLEVDENKLITIPDKSTCAGGTVAEQDVQPGGGDAIGTGGTTGTSNRGVGIMVATVAAIDLWWLSEDDSDRVSP